MKIRIKSADFLGGAPSLSPLPPHPHREVMFIGRSNVGKSSFINRLTNRKGLARTSGTPGRTQEINLFPVVLKDQRDKEVSVVLADLPGFGYSKFAKNMREELSRLTVEYLTTRENLSIVCLLNDARRLPEADEHAIQELAFSSDRHLLICLTKCDKLSKNELSKQRAAIARAYGLEPNDLIITGEKIDVEPVWERLLSLLALS